MEAPRRHQKERKTKAHLITKPTPFSISSYTAYMYRNMNKRLLLLSTLIFYALLHLKAVATAPISSGSGEPTETSLQDNSSNSAFSQNTTTEGAELGLTTIAPTAAPSSPYDCSITTNDQKAQAASSFKKGWSLIVNELNDRHLRHLVQESNCPPAILSQLNVARHPTVNRVSGQQGAANSIGKMEAYLRLVKQSLNESYNDDMQALYDVLSGTIQDLYKALSPIYCRDCTSPTAMLTCFQIPQLSTNYFSSECSLVSYISVTIPYEMTYIRFLTWPWLDSQAVGPLPEITTSDWLSGHVKPNSPALSKLM